MVAKFFAMIKKGLDRIIYFVIWGVTLITLVTLSSSVVNGIAEVLPMSEMISKVFLVPVTLLACVWGSVSIARWGVKKLMG